MADLSQIKVGSTTYNIKDPTARNDITTLTNNKANKTEIIPLNSTMAAIHTITSAEYNYLFSTVLGLGNAATLTYTEI